MGVKWVDGPLPWFILVHYCTSIKAQGFTLELVYYSMLSDRIPIKDKVYLEPQTTPLTKHLRATGHWRRGGLIQL